MSWTASSKSGWSGHLRRSESRGTPTERAVIWVFCLGLGHQSHFIFNLKFGYDSFPNGALVLWQIDRENLWSAREQQGVQWTALRRVLKSEIKIVTGDRCVLKRQTNSHGERRLFWCSQGVRGGWRGSVSVCSSTPCRKKIKRVYWQLCWHKNNLSWKHFNYGSRLQCI